MLRTFKDQNELKPEQINEYLLENILNKLSQSENKIMFYQRTSLINEVTYSEFIKDVKNTAINLNQKLNLKPKDLIAINGTNEYSTIVLYTAIFYCGATVIPLSPLDLDTFKINLLSEIHCQYFIGDLNGFNGKSLKPDELLLPTEDEFKPYKNSPQDIAAIFFTSGTTGSPKGVQLSFENLIINSMATIKTHELNEDSTHLSSLPLCHVNAFSFTYFTNLLLGSSFVMQESFFPINFWQIIQDHDIEIVSSTPHIINILNYDPREFNKKDFPKLRYFVSASAPLSHDDIKTFWNKYKTKIMQAYGLSESVNFSLTIPVNINDEDYKKVMLDQSTPSAGVPIWGNDLFIIDKNGNELSEDENGEIAIRGRNLFQGYYNNQAATDDAFQNDYFHTGDIGFYKIFNKQKYFYINGRIKEIIKRNGLLCYINEVEFTLKNFFKEIPFAICGFKNNYTKEEIGLVLPKDQNLDQEELKNFLLSSFPEHKRPKVVVFDKILTTSTNKPKRKEMEVYFNQFADQMINTNEIIFS